MIQKNKSGSFTVIWRDPARVGEAKDKRSFKTFEKYGDAKKFENKLQTELAEGTYATPSDHTLKEIATLYLEAGRRRWKIQSYLDEKGHVETYINPKLGHRKMVDLKFTDIERSSDGWGKTLGANSINKVYATINKIFKFGRKFNVKVNPMLDVERMRETVSLDDAELGKLIEASQPGLERIKHMTAIFSGVRHGELNGLRWQCVDLKRGRIFINRSLTELKGGGGKNLIGADRS